MSEADRTTLFGNEAFAIGMLQAVSGGSIVAAIAQLQALRWLVGTYAHLSFVSFMLVALSLAVLSGYWRHQYKMWDVKAQASGANQKNEEVEVRSKCAGWYLAAMRRAMGASVCFVILGFGVLLVALWVGALSAANAS